VEPARIRWLGLRIVLPLALFATHVVTGFAIAAARCQRGLLSGTVLGADAARLAVEGVTLVAIALAFWCAVSAAVDLTRLTRADADVADPNGLQSFALGAVLALSGLVGIYLIWATIAIKTEIVC